MPEVGYEQGPAIGPDSLAGSGPKTRSSPPDFVVCLPPTASYAEFVWWVLMTGCTVATAGAALSPVDGGISGCPAGLWKPEQGTLDEFSASV